MSREANLTEILISFLQENLVLSAEFADEPFSFQPRRKDRQGGKKRVRILSHNEAPGTKVTLWRDASRGLRLFFTRVGWLRQGPFITKEKHSELPTSFYPLKNPSPILSNAAQFQQYRLQKQRFVTELRSAGPYMWVLFQNAP